MSEKRPLKDFGELLESPGRKVYLKEKSSPDVPFPAVYFRDGWNRSRRKCIFIVDARNRPYEGEILPSFNLLSIILEDSTINQQTGTINYRTTPHEKNWVHPSEKQREDYLEIINFLLKHEMGAELK